MPPEEDHGLSGGCRAAGCWFVREQWDDSVDLYTAALAPLLARLALRCGAGRPARRLHRLLVADGFRRGRPCSRTRWVTGDREIGWIVVRLGDGLAVHPPSPMPDAGRRAALAVWVEARPPTTGWVRDRRPGAVRPGARRPGRRWTPRGEPPVVWAPFPGGRWQLVAGTGPGRDPRQVEQDMIDLVRMAVRWARLARAARGPVP